MAAGYDIAAQEWRPIRPDVAQGVWGTTLLDYEVKMQVVRVDPGGGFSSHRDGYGHIFYFLEGEGIVRVEDRQFSIHPGLVVNVAQGETHAYENTGLTELKLISINIPVS